MKSTVIKIYVLSTSYFLGLFLWPKISRYFELYNPFKYILFNYLFFYIILYILNLYKIKSKNTFNYAIKIIVLLAFMVEGIILQSALPAIHSEFCTFPPLYAFEIINIAITASFTGGLFMCIYLIYYVIYQIKKSIEKPKNYQYNQEVDRYKIKKSIIQDNSLFYISIGLLFFHISFLIPNISESIGCNKFSDNLVKPIGLCWILPGIFSIIYLAFLIIRRFHIRLTKKKALLISHG